ncbi:radical SAM protein [Rhodopila globiformis]|uniref:Radical SAM protein n=1 Tax=Rhodopila globiformis TaxID=1071 RepID=A0A2S6NH17_RHOGL|nr:radical SAM protein [Rhodopila globiformis]PPQ33945.1 radical SAM protein [Rhodopila globiformis]
MSWTDTIAGIEALEDLSLDPRLVSALEAEARHHKLPPLKLYTPSFRAYANEELKPCGRDAFPAFSVTGGACALNCDHCQAKILEPMIPTGDPAQFERTVRDMVRLRGLQGFLLSGGSNRRNEVPYDRYYPVVERLKRDFPHLRIGMHSGLLDRSRAQAMANAGVDVAMIDVIGADETIRAVYHLDRPVADFESTLAALCETRMQVVPHIVIGLHYGQLKGEANAVDIVARHPVVALVLVVVMPFYAPADKPFRTVPPEEAASVFVAARQRLHGVPVQLGCARPAGSHKMVTDAYAVMAGFDGIAYPAEGVVALARAIGRPVEQEHACCAISLNGRGGCA